MTEKLLLQGSHLLNTDLTPNDIDIFHEIGGACLGCVKGKMTVPPQKPWEIRTGAHIGEFWEMDIAHFGPRPYVILVEVITNFCAIYPLNSRKGGSLLTTAQQWYTLLKKWFPKLFASPTDGELITIKVKCDREAAFNVYASVVSPLLLTRTSAEGHASRVEVLIRIIKERARAIMYSLPYRLPSSRYTDLINFVVDIKNFLPSTVRSTSTAMEMVCSKKMREEDFLKLQFGMMVATIIPTNQRGPKTEAVAQEGIIVGFEPHTPSNIKIYVPSTNSIVCRSKVIPINSPGLIKQLNEMSRLDMVIDPFSLDTGVTNNDNDILIAASVEGGIQPTFDVKDYTTLDNMSLKQATKVFGHEQVMKSTLTELDNMEKMQVFRYIDPNTMDPKSHVMPSKIFYKAKTKDGKFDKLKARLVSRGDLQPVGSYGETKSPTADRSSLFMLCSLNKHIKGNIYSVDVPAAFLFAKLQENLQMRLPKEITSLVINAKPELQTKIDRHGRLVVRLLKSLYGLKQSPLNWYHHLVTVLEDAGFTGCITDRCVFFRKDSQGTTHLLFHVDDIFVSSNAATHISQLKTKFKNAFGDMEWMQDKFTFLGMHFAVKEDFSIDVDMVAYTLDIIHKHWTPEIGNEFKKRRGIINPSTDNIFHEVDHDDKATE
jgi:hypothetical protein